MSNRKFFDCKHSEEYEELKYIHPYALIVFSGLVAYCFDRNYPSPILTSIGRTKEENLAEGAESDSHVTLRAFDIRSSVYTQDQIEDICSYMNREFEMYAAITKSGKRSLAVYHRVTQKTLNGDEKIGGYHFHFQIHGRFRLPPFQGIKK